MSTHHEGYSVAEPEAKADETTHRSEGILTLCLQGITVVHCKAQTFKNTLELKDFCLSIIHNEHVLCILYRDSCSTLMAAFLMELPAWRGTKGHGEYSPLCSGCFPGSWKNNPTFRKKEDREVLITKLRVAKKKTLLPKHQLNAVVTNLDM